VIRGTLITCFEDFKHHLKYLEDALCIDDVVAFILSDFSVYLCNDGVGLFDELIDSVIFLG